MILDLLSFLFGCVVLPHQEFLTTPNLYSRNWRWIFLACSTSWELLCWSIRFLELLWPLLIFSVREIRCFKRESYPLPITIPSIRSCNDLGYLPTIFLTISDSRFFEGCLFIFVILETKILTISLRWLGCGLSLFNRDLIKGFGKSSHGIWKLRAHAGSTVKGTWVGVDVELESKVELGLTDYDKATSSPTRRKNKNKWMPISV